ncbi:L-threonylcarbamoyladenylate synthase [Natronomonas sp. EA1]|uniref:L-threonylcarbamoyladenylate synthase n=1 Tax=Natronomonas sp. EA1 TaxID=3421655 RepID=UPI003EC07353
MPTDAEYDRAAAALREGELVVYPTETVYGLAALATDADAVESLFEAKQRARDKPVSVAYPSTSAAADQLPLTERERRFMDRFLPGPVTVVVSRGELPPALTGGGDRVGVRVPDHPVSLALLERVAPITATSANVSGRASARTVADLDPEIRAASAVVLDGGETPGGQGSTVVDIEEGVVHREGPLVEEIRAWLAREE